MSRVLVHLTDGPDADRVAAFLRGAGHPRAFKVRGRCLVEVPVDDVFAFDLRVLRCEGVEPWRIEVRP